jgi:hypothetical protein
MGAEQPTIEPSYDLFGGIFSRTWLAAIPARQIGAVRSAVYKAEIAAKIVASERR